MSMTKIKTNKEIELMRQSGQMLAIVLNEVRHAVGPGKTTADMAKVARTTLKKLGGKPAFYGYNGFPDVICASINEEVVHGIPGSKIMQDGDIVSYDFGVSHHGMITDAAFSMVVGGKSDPSNIVAITEQALFAGIDVVKDGVTTGDIGNAVEHVLAKANLGIVRDLVGHGVGHELHEDPNIPNYGTAGVGEHLSAGMTIAIEPMTTIGSPEVSVESDGWTIVTNDRSLSAHFEHTILITQNGYEILTALPDNKS